MILNFSSIPDDHTRLAPTDAKFVEVIHTDIGQTLLFGVGNPDSLGHIDYFPNGGSRSPSCTLLKGML